MMLPGCASTDFDHVDTGQLQTWVPGYPNFTFSAWAAFENEEVVLKTYMVLPIQNLVFRSNSDGKFENRYERTLTVIAQQESGESVVINRTTSHEVIRENYRLTQSSQGVVHESKDPLPPGRYTVLITITDIVSRKRIQNRALVEIPDLAHGAFQIGSVLLQQFRPDRNHFRPVSAYAITQTDNALKTSLQVNLVAPDAPLEVRMHLLRFPSDTQPARPPHLQTPMIGSLQYRGINYEQPDTLQTNFRNLGVFSGTIDIDFELPELSPGNYRIEIITVSDGNVAFRRARDFAIMPAGFPSIRTMRQMNEALYYITTNREYEALTRPTTNDSLRMAFDRFWAERTGSRGRAQTAIELYFSRIEEANNLFTNHKEGWKTDFGMVYVLFGPPMHQERFADGISWYYQLGSHNIRFLFERGRSAGYLAPAENYILRRDRAYEQFFYRQFEDWRRGTIR